MKGTIDSWRRSDKPALEIADQSVIIQKNWITPGGYLQVNVQAGNPDNGGTAVFDNIKWNGFFCAGLSPSAATSI